MMVDTGFALTSLNQGLGKKLPRLDPANLAAPDPTWTALARSNAVLLVTVDIGGAQFYNQPAQVGDVAVTHPYAISFKARPALILGHDFLCRQSAVLYWREHALYVRADKPSTNVAWVMAESLRRSGLAPVENAHQLPNGVVVPLEVNGQAGWMLVDSGAFTTLIDRRFAAEAGLNLFITPPAKVAGVQGAQANLAIAPVRSLRLGGWESAKFEIGVAQLDPWLGAGTGAEPPPVRGLLGPDLLFAANVIVDYGTGRVFAKAAEK